MGWLLGKTCLRPAPLVGPVLALFLLGWFVPWTVVPDGQGIPVAEEATPDCGAVVPDGDPARQRQLRLAALGVSRWHAAGIRGHGIKIAVLDTGFRGYRTQLGKALPQRVSTQCFRGDGNLEARDSQHGILCAEAIHALAPAAELLLATWEPNCPEQFLRAVRWARQQGAHIISCSVIMPSWSDGEGGGPVHEALTDIVGKGDKAGDVLCFASAGNIARRHWCGPFRDQGDGFHAWFGREIDNRVKPWGSERLSIELCAPPGSRYQLSVHEAGTRLEVGRAVSGSPERGAVVRLLPREGRRYTARVRLLQGPAKPFHLVALGGELNHVTAQGSIPFPGDGAAVLAIGAVDADGRRLPYSSCGPNSARPKPDFVAPVPFPTLWRDRPFTGTSAAAPQAAALAALCWSVHPEWSADQVRAALRGWASDLGPQGHDWETGYGLIGLPSSHN